MNDLKIKKADINSLGDIQELNNKLFELECASFDSTLEVGWPLKKEGKEYFTEMINNHIVYIAIYDDKIVGYLAGSINKEIGYIKETFAELDNMYIDKEYRKFGIGTKLIEKFKEYCKDKKIQNIKVTASAKNINAIKFYKKNSFENYNVTLKYKV